MPPTKVVVVSDGVGATGQAARLRVRQEVAYVDLAAALASAGLAILKPKPISPEVALSRAIGDCKFTGTVKVSVGKGRWTIHRRIKRAGDHVDHQQTMVIKLSPTGVQFRYDSGQPDAAWEATLRESWEHHKLYLIPSDMSSWFDNVAQRALDAVDLDGRWYVPPAKKVVLRGLENVLAHLGIELSIWDVGMGASLVRDALAAMEAEAAPLIKEANDLLDQDAQKEPSERNLTARRAHVETLAKVREKMARYYAMFKQPMSESETRIMDLEARLASTFFRAAAADRGQDVSPGARVLDLEDAPATGETIVDDRRAPLLDLDDAPRGSSDEIMEVPDMPALDID